eukprot:scaffold73217_cov46-Prasinocladus_malaysianus.AAC.1
MDVIQRAGQRPPVKLEITVLPFCGRLVYDGLMMGNITSKCPPKRELEAKVAAAREAGRVFTRLDLPEPQAAPVSPADRHRTAAGTGEGPQPTQLSADASRAIQQIAAARRDTNETTFMWVCRRFGYSEAENPNHLAMFMAGPMPVPSDPLSSQLLEYTAEELLIAFAKG